jgi:trehalose synthase
VQIVEVTPIDPLRLREHIGDERANAFGALVSAAREELGDRTVWNVNSTATGGGVAEMLAQLVAYGLGAGVDTRWAVIEGDPEFFAVTKRIHNRLHGQVGDGGPLDDAERAAYQATTDRAAGELVEQLRPNDIVILHDPQTAGLVAPVLDAGAHVIWRCHVGVDHPNDRTEEAWAFLRPYLERAEHFVFSRPAHVPAWLADGPVSIVAPAIDPFAPKNAPIDDESVTAVLHTIGVIGGQAPSGRPIYLLSDGTQGLVQRRAEIVHDGPLPTDQDRYVVQVSRWDKLKDMSGVLRGFADHVVGHEGIDNGGGMTRLLLVGPSVAGVSDDPEGQQVLDECVEIYNGLPDEARERILLVSLPMDDVNENAGMVNAIQRRACIVVQKSLAEGFGLTVSEAMWKGRPVVASAVGGIQDQIVDHVTGILLHDPTDLAEFGKELREMLADPEGAKQCGKAARERVRERFLPDRQLTDWAEVLASVL